MNDRKLDQLLDAWLDAGPTVAPNRVTEAARLEIRTTRQSAALRGWPLRRFPSMNNTMRIALATTLVAVAALLGFNYLIAPNIGGPGLGDPTPSPSPIPTPSPSPFPALSGQDPLPAGRYQADPALPMDVTIEVPDGWSAGDAWVVRGPHGNQWPDGMAIRFYSTSNMNLYNDPLAPGDGFVESGIGTTVDELVAAMVGHPDWTVTGTDPIMIDGYAGQVVHVTLPEGTTDDTPFYLFGDAAGFGQVWGWAAGQLHDLHILDVAGERLVVEAFHYPGTSAADLAAQQAVLDSIQIEVP